MIPSTHPAITTWGVQHDQGKGYQQPIIFRSQSGQVEKKLEYLYFIPYNLVLNGATELDTVVP